MEGQDSPCRWWFLWSLPSQTLFCSPQSHPELWINPTTREQRSSLVTNYKGGSVSPRKGEVIHAALRSNKAATFSELQNIRKHPICLQILNLELQASLTQSFAYLKKFFNEAISSKQVCWVVLSPRFKLGHLGGLFLEEEARGFAFLFVYGYVYCCVIWAVKSAIYGLNLYRLSHGVPE